GPRLASWRFSETHPIPPSLRRQDRIRAPAGRCHRYHRQSTDVISCIVDRSRKFLARFGLQGILGILEKQPLGRSNLPFRSDWQIRFPSQDRSSSRPIHRTLDTLARVRLGGGGALGPTGACGMRSGKRSAGRGWRLLFALLLTSVAVEVVPGLHAQEPASKAAPALPPRPGDVRPNVLGRPLEPVAPPAEPILPGSEP